MRIPRASLFACLLVLAMIFSFLPGGALANSAVPPTDPAQDTVINPEAVTDKTGIILNKTAAPTDDPNKFEITLTAKAEKQTAGGNADVVLVVDNSGSMATGVGKTCENPKENFIEDKCNGCHGDDFVIYTCDKCGARYYSSEKFDNRPELCTGQIGGAPRIDTAKAVSEKFAKIILGSETTSTTSTTSNRLAIVSFEGRCGRENDRYAIVENASTGLTDKLGTINNAIESMRAEGGTNYTAALAKAWEILDSRKDKTRPAFVVFISDGAPGYSGKDYLNPRWNGSCQACKLKQDGVTIYTVGIALCDGESAYLRSLASDPNGEHYMNVTGDNYAEQLSEFLDEIAMRILNPFAGATITDSMGADVTLNPDTVKSEGADPVPKVGTDGTITTITWELTSENVTEKEEDGKTYFVYTLTYNVMLNENARDGEFHDTNTNATLTLADETEIKFLTPRVMAPSDTPGIGQATVTFKVKNGTWSDDTTTDKTVEVQTTNGKGTLKKTEVPTGMKANTGYEKGKWDEEPNTAPNGITKNVTYTYTFRLISGGGGGGGSTPRSVTVTFKVENGTWSDNTRGNQIVKVPIINGKGTLDAGKVPTGMKADTGYEKGKWDEEPNTAPNGITNDVIYTYAFRPISGGDGSGVDLAPPVLNKEDHVTYVVGMPDGRVYPEKQITRAETATIFFRLLTQDSRTRFYCKINDFSDVAEEAWYNKAVSTMAKADIVSGYPDGSFRPDASITRAEFATIAARFSDVVYNGGNTFTDVPDAHWAARYISLAEYLGWISGMPDGTFQPDRFITRAEAVTLINRVLERAVEPEHMLDDMIVWPDNPVGAWYYEAVQEATNSHLYVRSEKTVPEQDFCFEEWVELIASPDWAVLENPGN